MDRRDPRGLYAALKLSPTASQMEIRLAYKFLRNAHREGRRQANIGKIQQAFETLGDPQRRTAYDRSKATTGDAAARSDARQMLNSGPVLVLAAAVLVVALGIAVGPAILARFVSFDVGDELRWKKTDRPLGVVVEYSEHHDFEEAPDEAAYKIRLGSGEEQWFAAAALRRHCEAR